jgi:probable F420-dependent oxidoreductase
MGSRLRIGVISAFDGRPGRTMADLRELARHAEAAGVDGLWFPEHVVFFRDYTSKYPYSADGNPSFGKRAGVYDPLFAATVAAAVTSRIRVGTAILIVAQRNPVVLAQEVVAVDHASTGRFDLGIGVGWSSEEFEAIGVPWAGRGARTDEYLDAMEVLWRDELCTFDGDAVSFHDVVAEPKPVQQPRPPVLVGGGDAAMRRAARRGDGWYGFAVPAAEIASTMRRLDGCCDAVGRDPSTLRRVLGLPWSAPVAELAGYLEEAARHGVGEVTVALPRRGAALLDAVAELGALDR